MQGFRMFAASPDDEFKQGWEGLFLWDFTSAVPDDS